MANWIGYRKIGCSKNMIFHKLYRFWVCLIYWGKIWNACVPSFQCKWKNSLRFFFVQIQQEKNRTQVFYTISSWLNSWLSVQICSSYFSEARIESRHIRRRIGERNREICSNSCASPITRIVVFVFMLLEWNGNR